MQVTYINKDVASEVFIAIMNRNFDNYDNCYSWCKDMLFMFGGNNAIYKNNDEILFCCDNSILIKYSISK